MQFPRKGYNCLRLEWLTASNPSLARLLSDALQLLLKRRTGEEYQAALINEMRHWGEGLGDSKIADEISDLEIALRLEGATGARHCFTYIVEKLILGNRMSLFDAFGRGFNCLNSIMKMSEYTSQSIYKWLTIKDNNDFLQLLKDPDISTPERETTYNAVREWLVTSADIHRLRVFHFLITGHQESLGNSITICWRNNISMATLQTGDQQLVLQALEPEFHTCFNHIDLTL